MLPLQGYKTQKGKRSEHITGKELLTIIYTLVLTITVCFVFRNQGTRISVAGLPVMICVCCLGFVIFLFQAHQYGVYLSPVQRAS